MAAFDLKLIEAKLAGGLPAGFLALKFTGEQLENFFTQAAWRRIQRLSLQNLARACHMRIFNAM